MVHWSEYFWSEGNRGFEVLSSNVKYGAIAIEEFQRFLNESAQCESVYYKSLSRLQSQLTKNQYLGTFTPIWSLIRDLFDKISSTHSATVSFYQELLRDIHNYQDLYQKKVKTHIQKDADILRSAELISQLHNSLHIVNKAKEQYHSITLDYERAKRTGNSLFNTSSSATSQDNNSPGLAQTTLNALQTNKIERLERKCRLAQDEYKLTIEKYNLVRNDYEKRFQDACTKFQDFEIDHIEKMLVFSLTFSDILQRNHEQMRLAQNDFNDKLKSLSGNDLLDAFVEQKKTGTDRPVALQIEEVDNLRASAPPTNHNTPDILSGHDDSNQFDQLESSVPSFQAHFNVSPSNTKSSDNNNANNNRVLSQHSGNTHSNAPSHNLITSPTANITTTSPNVTTSSNQMFRSPEPNSSNEQTSNPFDVKIRRPKFTGFFGTGRKERKEKKNEKKPSTNIKSAKTSQVHQSRDESNEVHLQNSNYEVIDYNKKTDNNDGSIPSSFNTERDKCSTPEPYTQSSPPILKNEHKLQVRYSGNPPSLLKTSNSTDTSSDDDDDDNPMLKIDFKINPKSEILSDVDDETKIVNAMRLIDKNMGNFMTTSRGQSNRNPDLNKSFSIDQLGTRTLPPPIPLRAALTSPNSVTTDNTDNSSMFPSHDEFHRSHSNLTSNTLTNQEDLFAPLQSTIENTNVQSISSTDDDTEVANSFHHEDLTTNKKILFPRLQVPSVRHLNQQQPKSTSVSPSIASINANFRNSPIISHEQTMSPLTPDTMDQIPLAIAFQEIIHVMMSGNNQENWKSRIVGEMLISFPASILNLFVDPSYFSNRLQFRLKNLDHIENIIAKSSLITQNESSTDSNDSIYSFDMTGLHNALQNLQEKNPSSLFFNLNVLNYEIKHTDVSNIPIQMSSQWTRTFDTISVNINYSFNSSALPNSIRLNNDTVIFYTIITDGQEIKESSPTAEWSVDDCKLWWKVPYVNNGTGNLSATIITIHKNTIDNDNDQQQQQPLTASSIVNAYFLGENALFSSIDFELACSGYRISLLKKKILSGKYQSEPDQTEPLHLFQRPITSASSTF